MWPLEVLGMTQLEKKAALQRLVEELIKDEPQKPLIKELTSELGLDYSVDMVTQMSTVLESMNSVYLQSNRRKDLER